MKKIILFIVLCLSWGFLIISDKTHESIKNNHLDSADEEFNQRIQKKRINTIYLHHEKVWSVFKCIDREWPDSLVLQEIKTTRKKMTLRGQVIKKHTFPDLNLSCIQSKYYFSKINDGTFICHIDFD